MKVVISAAGTGGHINPGIAIANKIMEEEPDSKVIFIGTPTALYSPRRAAGSRSKSRLWIKNLGSIWIKKRI